MIEPFFPFFLFRQLCLYISDSLHLFTLLLTDSLKKCQTKSFENEYSTFCNFQILYHKSTLQIFLKENCYKDLLVSENRLFRFMADIVNQQQHSGRNATSLSKLCFLGINFVVIFCVVLLAQFFNFWLFLLMFGVFFGLVWPFQTFGSGKPGPYKV